MDIKDDGKKEAIKGIFDRASSTYDSVGPGFFSYFGRRLVELSGIEENSKVLDVACGRGAALFAAKEAAGRDSEVVGIDLSGSMVNETSKEISRRSLNNTKALCMDAEYLDFPDEYFDRVLCGFCVFFFPEPERALKEIFRVMKQNGRIALSTWGKYGTRDWHIELAKKHLGSRPGCGPMPQLAQRRFEDPQELVSVLRATGFCDTSVVYEKKEFYYKNEEEWWATQYSHGIRATLENVEKLTGTEGLARFKSDALEHFRTLKNKNGFCQRMKAVFFTAVKP